MMATKKLNDPDLEIRPFRCEDQAEAQQLILSGLAERWGTLDPTYNADLKDIATHYQQGVFLVAKISGELVGTGSFMPVSASVVQVMRMSVARHIRRLGLGKHIFRELCNHARKNGYSQIILETTATWTDAVLFYDHCGCRRTHQQDGDQHFVFDL
jgi:GNAT superfamily N-acetyltransferase